MSWLAATSGGSTLVPSRELDSTVPGIIKVEGLELFPSWKVVSASDSMKAERRICNPAVPFTDATLPASVLTS